MLKKFLRDWVIPPALLRLRHHWQRPSIQKFWAGTPLPASPREAAYFSSAGLGSRTLTRSDDSRNAGIVAGSTAELPVPAGPGDHVQLAVAVDEWHPTDRLDVSVGGEKIVQTNLSSSQWLDLRIPAAGSTAAPVKVNCTRGAYVTMPRRVTVQPGDVSRSRHVLILVLDGMTPYLRPGGETGLTPDPATPNINRFFEEGYLASNGWTTGEWTLPATGSFFTGLYTSRHRMWHPTLPVQMKAGPTLATIYQDAGYHSLAFSTANRFTPAYGSHRGFDRFLYHWPFQGHTALNYDPARWCDEILGHLDAHRHDRTFTYAHFPDTHPAWNVPPLTRFFNLQRRGDSTGHGLDALKDHRDAKAQGMQMNAIRLHELDRLLGGVFDFIDRQLRERTLVVLTADHGTPWSALRARRPADEPYLVDHRCLVELRMRGPGVARRHFEGLCSPTVDLMPTVLALSGLEAPVDIDGRNLLDPAYRRDTAASESLYGKSYEVALRDGGRTYIEKHPMHETLGTVAGPADYRKCFARGTADYAAPIAGECDDLAAAALAHRRAVGMTGP